MANKILPECLIVMLFNKQREIELANYKFHKVFFGLKKESEYRDLLGDIRFSGSEVNPYSEALEEALFNLQYAGALSRQNPALIVYSTTEKFNDSYHKLVSGLDETIMQKLDAFSSDFLGRL